MLARPMARHQAHPADVGLVQRHVIDDQQPFVHLDTPLYFCPQRRAIRRQALQQARVGVMRGLSFASGWLRAASAALDTYCAVTRKLM